MPEPQKIEFSQLATGHEFPTASYTLDSSVVASYLEAVEETSRLYQENELVPPMAIAARAMAAMSEGISLPPGTIHVSQELEFIGSVRTNDTLTSRARVSKNQSRGGLHLLTIELNVVNQGQQKVLDGKTSFILPEGGEA